MWEYGIEIPLHSLREEFELAGLTDIQESGIAFDTALDFFDFLPEQQTLKDVVKEWYDALTMEEKRLFPGYLIAASGTVTHS